MFTTDGSEQQPLPYEVTHPEFDAPRNDFSIGPDGRIYLLDQRGGTWVRVYEADGTPVTEWGGTVGFEPESLFDARTIAVTPDGDVFTARPGLLQQFTSDGQFVAAWDRAGDALFPLEVYDMDIVAGQLYVAGTGYRDDQSVILTFDLDGNLVADPLVIGEAESEDRIFPASLAIGQEGNLFIFDPFSREVIVLTTDGDEVNRWSLEPTDQRFPVAEIAVDDTGHVYIADHAHKVVNVYAPK